jgi:hypothetical protein
MTKPRHDLPHLTAPRAGRLFRLLTLLGAGPQPRDAMMKKLKVDQRSFYRDLELLRARGVEVTVDGTRYALVGDVEAALAKLPVPDPGLIMRDALVLARGDTEAHRRFRRHLDSMMRPTRPATPTRSRLRNHAS